MADLDTWAAVRSMHARRYLIVARPVVVGLALLSWPIAWLVDPDSIEPQTAPLLLLATTVVAVSILLLRWISPLTVASASVIVDSTLVVASILVASQPAETSMMLLWPIIGIAYFAGWRWAIWLTFAATVLCVVLGATLPAWDDPRPIPIVAITIAVCGTLISFVMRQSRYVEHQLARANERDRRALEMSRHVRLAPGLDEACSEIAREIVHGTGATFAAVALFEHDSDYVAEAKHYEEPASAVTFDPSMLDATLRHLAAGGFAAIHSPDATSLRAVEPAVDDGSPDTRAVHAAFIHLLEPLGFRSGIVVPLILGGRAVGTLVLAAIDDGWQEEAFYLMEPLAPQLAAGLAQAMLMRDQRDALESLERLDRMRDRLIANVSHELRTPLTSTIGFVETLLRTDVALDEAQRLELMQHARDGGLRLLALVEDLLALGSTRPESLDLAPEPLSASELVTEAIRGIDVDDGRRIEVEVDDDVLVRVDRNRMMQVVGNLVVNAVHHGRGAIQVRCHQHDGTAVIDVLDEGSGVAAEHVDELFLPFSRFSTRPDSTGLGLAICRTIVEAHGGVIDYDRVDGGRTRFRVRLPVPRSYHD